MKNLLKISACWLLTLTGLAGCGVEVYTGGEEGDVPLTFAGGAESHTLTRGTMAGNITAGETTWTTWPYYTNEDTRSKMTVNGVYYVDAMTPLGQQFMYDQEVIYTSPDTWSYTPIKYWPNVGYLDLYALTPSLDQLAAELTEYEKGSGIRNLTYYHQPKDGVLISFDYSTRKPGGTPPEVSDLAKPDEGHLNDGTKDIPVSPGKIDADFNKDDLTRYQQHETFADYADAQYQPDLMLAYHPHLAKPTVGTKVAMNFTHSLMAVRFWLRGNDNSVDLSSNDFNINDLKSCAFKQISDFRLESVSLGNVYYSGHCDAYDKTDWAAYGTATNGDLFKYDSSTPVLLTYRWSFDNDADPREWFTQKTDFSLRERYLDTAETNDDFPKNKSSEWWALPKSVPLIPDFRAPNEGYSSGQIEGHTGVGAFLLPPQALQGNHQDLRVSFTMTDDDGTTLTQTLESKMPMTVEEAATTGLVIGPGQVLDIYLTFHLDGDDYFKFQIDAQISDWGNVAGYTTDLITNW